MQCDNHGVVSPICATHLLDTSQLGPSKRRKSGVPVDQRGFFILAQYFVNEAPVRHTNSIFKFNRRKQSLLRFKLSLMRDFYIANFTQAPLRPEDLTQASTKATPSSPSWMVG